MVLYRITKCNYANDLSGTGARLYGGRWNSEGKDAIYLASSRSLAVLEVLVHLPPLMIPDGYCLVEIEVPDNSIKQIYIEAMPANWKDVAGPVALKRIGDEFLKDQQYLLMKMPSSIVPMEHNYLLNPQHPAMKKVRILKSESFDFDERLV
ncbi:RES family NAD+ phosphorylase [Mucilaginibacter gotjawali]|uniref:RES domain-containing protein n=2 Tax=Mucilaginibacter gotjawali TaxID=1550579 RepID=A0A839SC53_9SPHI|nr:RES family NAD+ phosphorylase [Mucilaginibacter gotjawali]MBB3055376.1 RES domain-containing protein [Mucilaginibacter gotjawali]BAU53347.1 RES domain protein [Mucilaginibacter gotjawali]